MSNTQAAAVYRQDGSVHFASVEALHQFLAIQTKANAAAAAVTTGLVETASIAERRAALVKKALTAKTIRQPITLIRIRDGKKQFVQNANRDLFASAVPGVDISGIQELTQYWDNTTQSYGTARVTKVSGVQIPAYMAKGVAEAIYGEVGKNWKRNRGLDSERHAARFQLIHFRR